MHYARCMICIAKLLGILHWEQNFVNFPSYFRKFERVWLICKTGCFLYESNGTKFSHIYEEAIPYFKLCTCSLLFFNSVEKEILDTRPGIRFIPPLGQRWITFAYSCKHTVCIIFPAALQYYIEYASVFISSRKSYGFQSSCGRIVLKTNFQLNAVEVNFSVVRSEKLFPVILTDF